jgi:peptide/nickel transport system permease protein
MSVSHAVQRALASVPYLAAAAVVAVVAGAGLGDAARALLGGVVTLGVLASALVVGAALGTLAATRAALGGGAALRAAARSAAALNGAVPALLLAAVLAVLAAGGDAATAWIAYAVPAFAYGAATALGALDAGADGAIVVAALGRGVPPGEVFRRHALPLTLARAADGAGPTIGLLTAGAGIVEHLCNVPGAGRMCATAALIGDSGAATAALTVLCLIAVALDAAAGATAAHWLPRRTA